MIRAVVTGSECTGKTTLARALAGHYDAPWIAEYARQFVVDTGAPPEYRDVDAIARGQIALEDERIAEKPLLLIQDTDLLSTVVYSRHYYGACPSWVEQAFLERPADLYLLAGIDVPWVADEDQRDRGDRREEMHELFRGALVEWGLLSVEVRGSRQERLRDSVAAVDDLLSR